MFEVLERSSGGVTETKEGCIIRCTPLTVVDLPTPFRIVWNKDGQHGVGLVTYVNRLLSPTALVDLAPGDIVFLTVRKWAYSTFTPGMLLHVRP